MNGAADRTRHSISRLVGRVYASVSDKGWHRVGLVAGIIGFLGDVSSIFGDFVFWGLLICLVLSVVFGLLLLINQNAARVYFPCGASCVGLLVFASVLLIQTMTSADAKGVVATYVPGVAELQASVAGLVQRVDKLSMAVRETGDDVKATRRSVDEVLEIQKIAVGPAMTQRMRDAIASGNGADLAALGPAEPFASTIRSVFADGVSAAAFFERAKGDDSALEWFRNAVASTLDPNLLVRRADGKAEAIIVTAFRAGNASAVVALLQAGAHPHGYQDLQLDPSTAPFFVAPLRAVLRSESYSEADKVAMARAMIDAGVLVPAVPPPRGDDPFSNEQRAAFQTMPGQLSSELGLGVTPLQDVCAAPPSGACAPGKALADDPVCDFRNTIPAEASAELHGLDEFASIAMIGLMGVFDGRAYYLGRSPGYDSDISVIAVAPDRRRWTVFKSTQPTAGLGALCNEEQPSRYQQCWLSLKLSFDPGARQLSVMGKPFATRFCPAT